MDKSLNSCMKNEKKQKLKKKTFFNICIFLALCWVLSFSMVSSYYTLKAEYIEYIFWSIVLAKLGEEITTSLWNLAGMMTAALMRHLLKFKVILCLQSFAISHNKIPKWYWKWPPGFNSSAWHSTRLFAVRHRENYKSLLSIPNTSTQCLLGKQGLSTDPWGTPVIMPQMGIPAIKQFSPYIISKIWFCEL